MLKLLNVSCTLGGKRVLQNINFSLAPGTFLGVIGPNGAGKTTLLRLIGGLIGPDEGKILVEGRDVRFFSRQELSRKVAIVPQNTYINFPFTCFEVVLMGRYPHLGHFEKERKKDLEKVEECMHLTKTWYLKDRKVTQISGGELQRVVIAQALAQDTPLLLLDEPTSHLDINNQLEILQIIYQLNRKKGKSIILVSHDLNIAARWCDKLILLKEGKIFAQGEVEKVLTSENIRSVYHINALVKKHPLTGFVYALPISLLKEKKEKEKKGRVHLIGGGGSASRMIRELVDEGYDISLGVVNIFDADFETAKAFGIPCVVEAPFSPITEDSYKKNIQLIDECQVVVLCNVPFGKGNLLNLKSALQALENKAKVVVLCATPIEQRDYTGGEARKMFQALFEKGAHFVRKEEEVISFIRGYFSKLKKNICCSF